MNRTVNRVAAYEARRAIALDLMEHKHDKAIETRLRASYGHVATGWKALLIRKTLTTFAIREAERNTR